MFLYNNSENRLYMIPQTFEQWKTCLVNDCKVSLTKEFATRRLAVYHDLDKPETKKFIRLYGFQHYQNIIGWFTKIVEGSI
ncbi:hypothetical protein EDF66_10747 [Sphingobacterium sp. JUb20]|nr:hypothetical protein EDF66_10747 [Sphingobacterium sp. JUb20]